MDGVPLREKENKTYILLNKPRGYVSTLSDEKGRSTVAELVRDVGARVFPVGRLDMVDTTDLDFQGSLAALLRVVGEEME